MESRIVTVDMVDVDVADRAQARALYMLYFQAETMIIVSSNSESDTEDVRLRKVHDVTSKSKGRDMLSLFSVLPAGTRSVHTARRAGQRNDNRKKNAFQHDLIYHGHGINRTIDRGDNK